MDFVKQSAHDRNSWRDVQFGGLANLTFVAGVDVPLDVIDQHRPPEVQQQTHSDWKDTLVPEAIMCLLSESVMMLNWHNQLMSPMLLSTIQRPVQKEKASGCIDKEHVVCVMVGDPPISFSPFTLADCMLFFHFSFNTFIATTFLDLAEDLDIQI